jgi:hypothetical protein
MAISLVSGVRKVAFTFEGGFVHGDLAGVRWRASGSLSLWSQDGGACRVSQFSSDNKHTYESIKRVSSVYFCIVHPVRNYCDKVSL